MEIQFIWHGSQPYLDLVRLRHLVLREPLGLDFSEEDLADEEGEAILGIEKDGEWIACVHLKPAESESLKLRQMAVDPRYQGLGIGESLILAAEEMCNPLGYSDIFLHARETAVGFYEKCGYSVEGEPFVEVGLPHRLMRKRFANQ